MCVITDRNNTVVGISLLPGTHPNLIFFNVYFPVDMDKVPKEGDLFYGPYDNPRIILKQDAA